MFVPETSMRKQTPLSTVEKFQLDETSRRPEALAKN